MAEIELRFFKEDSTPWGFRLTGGSDFEMPLQVIKVSKGSIAEKAGMQLGDIPLRINNTATADLTHIEAHDVILNAGNDFTITVIRGELPPELKHEEINVTQLNVNINNDYEQQQQICIDSMESEVCEQETETIQISGNLETQIELNVQIREEEYITEEVQEPEISHEKIISGHATVSSKISSEMTTVVDGTEKTQSSEVMSQVSSDQEVGNVDFQKCMPDVEFIKDSEVMKEKKNEVPDTHNNFSDTYKSSDTMLLKILSCLPGQESEVINEAAETKAEMKKQQKKWSTFLQKPKRPKPKDKKQEAERPKEPPYRVVIVKGKKKSEQVQETHSQESTPSVEVAEVSACETTPDLQQQEPVQQEQEVQEIEEREEENEHSRDIEDDIEDNEPVVSEMEMSLEDQLAAVQRQLMALSQLPAAIQQTLDVVTSQLAKIVGPVQGQEDNQNQIEEEQEESQNDDSDYQQDDYENELDILDEIPEEGESDQEAYQSEELRDIGEQQEEEQEDGRQERIEVEAEPVMPSTPEENLTPEEREARKLEQDKQDKKEKDHKILDDLRQRRIKERPNYPFPITPLERPICLPGGRRWHMPGDAFPEVTHPHMTDDAIAETISSQTEIEHWNKIWPWGDHLGRRIYRINFLKYQPIPKPLDHLRNSEVYKLVHDLEPAPRGIPARASKAQAEEDYYTQISKEGNQQQQSLNK